jgi:CBS domain-containing protein
MSGSGKVVVHVRRLATTGAVNPGDLEVYCPDKDKSVAVNLCKSCIKFVTCGADPRTSRTFVECRQLTADSTKSLRSARRAVLTRRPQAGTSFGDRTPVTEIMSRQVSSVRRGVELTGVRRLFSTLPAEALPVVNEHGEPIGIILRSAAAADTNPVRKAGELMERLTFVLPDSATISQVAALMAIESVAHLPIVGKDGQVVGMVSWIDVLRWFAQTDGYVVPERG